MIVTHAKALDGKTIIDATNNVSQPAMHSLATFAKHTPNARAFRAFNTLGWENFEDPQFSGVRADLFFCGPDGDARSTVERLISDVGLRPIYVGGVEQVDVVDGLSRLWFALAFGQNMGRHLAFKLLQ